MPERHPWPGRLLALAFLGLAGYSAYLAARLLAAHCEGFSCTYLGVAWMFWLGVLALPAAGLGWLAQRSPRLAAGTRVRLRRAWQAHGLVSLGVMVTWVLTWLPTWLLRNG